MARKLNFYGPGDTHVSTVYNRRIETISHGFALV